MEEVKYGEIWKSFPNDSKNSVRYHVGSKMGEVDINTLTIEKYLALTRGNQALGMVKPELGGNVNFEEPYITQSCYVYFPSHSLELRKDGWKDYLREQSTPRICSSRISFKGIVHHLKWQNNLRTSITSSKKMMRHCTKLGKGAHLDKECPLREDVKSMEEVKYGEIWKSFPNDSKNSVRYHVETQVKHLTKDYQAMTANEVPKSSIRQCKAVFTDNEAQRDELYSNGTTKLHRVSFISDNDVQVPKKMDEGPSGVLPCQLTLKELSPISFTLPCTIGSLNIYAIAKLDMLRDPNETMILGRPFLAPIYAQINVFHGEISLGIGEDRIMFDINENIHHLIVPVEKVLSNGTFKFWPTYDPSLKECNGGDRIYRLDERGVLKQWYCYRNNERKDVKGKEINPCRTLGAYSKPSYEGYQNTTKIPDGNNVLPLRSDTIRLMQNGCSFHGLRSEDPNQHLKDFLKLVDSLDLNDDKNKSESLSEAWTRFKDLLQKVPHYSIDLWLHIQIFYDHVNLITRRTIDQAAGDVPSTSDRCFIKLKNQAERLMEAHLTPYQPIQVNKITSSCDICSGPHDTQYCMENPKQAFIDYASSRTGEAGGRGFLAIVDVVIDCKKAKIMVGEGLTRSVFGVRETDLVEENVPYWTTV
nr:MAK10-like protein [Tanacetum cinerariifolium]